MSSYRFDLEKTIAAWRRPFEHNRAFSSEDIEELEGSLRDRVAVLVETGLPEEAAFEEALGRIGSYATAEEEYRKVYWGKRRRRGEVLHELHWRAAMLKNHLKIALRQLTIDQMGTESASEVRQEILNTLSARRIERKATNVIYAVAQEESTSA